MRIGVLLWPSEPWDEISANFRRAEEYGFAHAWVFDHVAWRDIRPWYDAFAVLAGAAAVTSRIGLGTMVTTPRLRHPVNAAKSAMTLDMMSGGRFTLGVGAAAGTSDSGILGSEPATPRERADRFEEWVEMADLLLRQGTTTYTGRFWSTENAGIGGRDPRLPFAIAATGPRGMRLAARFAQTWITQDVGGFSDVRRQCERLSEIVAETRPAGEPPRRLIAAGAGPAERPLASVEAFKDYAGRYGELGITDVVLHWPRPDGPYQADPRVLEEVAALGDPA
ncbi:LLM class flavin-dependent oxidoreductase [Bailinhaonella thermotolerans]|uniref:LLM class flavin-dependent oxidoreductase n=1 Tax=Bailinhaonella thermotolerans TaxID=1070861 RepID=A0A3A4B4D1_9ACTN|nr:LLM class flavin-dependent oxidoreductase [Bailinhaonella thermotolerans]RJL32220.1 LLM class flavin-dependent oxidoreductase [Bailinhaonella thermotolerans]